METLTCPYCDSEVKLSQVEAEEGCCPECGSAISTDAAYNDNYDDDDFDEIDDFDDDDDSYDDEDDDDDSYDDDDDDDDEDYDDYDDDDEKFR